MSGHGWVTPNPSGVKARCGGPALCRKCREEAEALGLPLGQYHPMATPSEPITFEACAQCRGSGKAPFMPKCPGCGGKGSVPRTILSEPKTKPEDDVKGLEEMVQALNAALMQAQLEKASMMNALADAQRASDECRTAITGMMLAATEHWDEELFTYRVHVSKAQWEAFKAFVESV